MWLMFSQWRKMFFPNKQRKPLRRAPRYVRPRLEVLENRLVLDAYVFAPNGIGDATSWFNTNNWLDTTNPANIAVPGANDSATIGSGFNVVIAGQAAEANSLTLGMDGGGGSTLTIDSSLNVNTMVSSPGAGNLVTVAAAGPAVLTINSSANFGGPVNDFGRIDANTTNPYTGTSVDFSGTTVIGPGDLNGNLVAGPNSSFSFDWPSTFAAGATFGLGSGDVYINAPVAIMGNFYYQTMTLDLAQGGFLYGPGNIQDNSAFNWTGGTLAVAGGLYNTSDFTASGSNTLSLDTTVSNESLFMNLVGTGTLGLDPGGAINNLAGTVFLSQSTVSNTNGGTGGITNSALGILDVTAPATAPTVMSVPLTNEGTLNVNGGDSLMLTTPLSSSGAANIILDGSLGLSGNLYLFTTASSTSGFGLSGAGDFEVGSPLNGLPGPPGPVGGPRTLIVPNGATDHLSGNLVVNGDSLLTGGGKVSNDGLLQLEPGSSTLGLGSYLQGNSGKLALDMAVSGMAPSLDVTGMATLSGTLELLNYTPVVGDSFVVVTAAGGVQDHFDSVPAGMVETNTPTTASVTQETLPP